MTPTAVLTQLETAIKQPPISASKTVPPAPPLVPAPRVEDATAFAADETYGEVLCVEERLVLAPCTGRFRSWFGEYTVPGQYVTKGQVVGTVVSRDGEARPVSSPFSGWVMGHLVSDGGPVNASAPVVWLRRQ